MINNYKKIELECIPDCCGVCSFGDEDGMGCDTLGEILGNEEALNVSFNYFHVCDLFERVNKRKYDSYWPCSPYKGR